MSTSPLLRNAATVLGLGRAGFGVYLLASPQRAGRAWFGTAPDRPATEVLLRSVGGRDLALGAGLVAFGPSPSWLRAVAVSDLTDGVATLVAGSRLPKRNLVMGVAFAVAFGAAALAVERAAA